MKQQEKHAASCLFVSRGLHGLVWSQRLCFSLGTALGKTGTCPPEHLQKKQKFPFLRSFTNGIYNKQGGLGLLYSLIILLFTLPKVSQSSVWAFLSTYVGFLFLAWISGVFNLAIELEGRRGKPDWSWGTIHGHIPRPKRRLLLSTRFTHLFYALPYTLRHPGGGSVFFGFRW